MVIIVNNHILIAYTHSSVTVIEQFQNLLSRNMSGNFFSEKTCNHQQMLKIKKLQ